MARTPRMVAAAVVATLALSTLVGTATPAGAELSEPANLTRPNVVLVVVDDMRADELTYMPATSELLAGTGTTFTNAFATFPLCCPSRASILTGQYPHNTGVLDNHAPLGGFSAFDDSNTIATWLDSTGYTTGYVGKYLNEYARASSYVPPGWDVWDALVGGIQHPRGPNTYNVNGVLEQREGFQTDVLTDRAVEFLTAHPAEPKLLHLAYVAPHTSQSATGWIPPIPAPRHEHSYDGLPPPSSPAYDEADVSDKPVELQRPPMTADEIAYTQQLAEGRAEALQSVDEGIARLVSTLEAQGELDNTYLVFTSDNGYFLGEHRRPSGKIEPYEPVAKVPLVISGPQFPVGTSSAVVGLHDLAPTFLEVTGSDGAQGDFVIDGREILSLARPQESPGRDLLIQARRPNSGGLGYKAVRTNGGWKYVKYASGAEELYDLNTDPHELDNLAGREEHANRQRALAGRLDRIRGCDGDACR